ncbi:endo-1 4-beta-xylanase a [Phtheirospermum japonicum]|uniref:Endo-1 4-beta-xylanase a n=1 Tax=Phtheirospermum japonicum TaxID=374723 RepID=A0A830DMK0_9LAMI|nr:endo-1 4-beta-xylanase a [Phtheirospermum japonicum]
MFFIVVVIFIVFGLKAYAVPYDDSYTLKCLATPLNAQYDGGIVVNPELNEGLNGWTVFGDAKIEHLASDDGNKFIVASNRYLPHHSFAQTFYLETGKLYIFSAWLQVSHGKADVAAIFKTEASYETVGRAIAQKNCWSMLKGGLVVKTSGPAQLYFETNNTDVDLSADSISLQSFTKEEWKSHQQQRIKNVRKTRVRLQAVDQAGRPMANATVSLTQTRPGFPLGCAINKNILYNPAYQSWFLSRFTHTVFENELKWYSTEYTQGFEDYSTSDAMVQFTQSHGLKVRGQNVLWDNPDCQPQWAKGLSSNELWAAANKRIHSVMSRYQGKFIQWDVVNENMHYNFFENNLGSISASTYFYQTANQIDPATTPFLNEYNTIEWAGDPASSPAKYMEKIGLLRSQGYHGPLGFGLESHFTQGNVNPASIRTSLEMLAQAGLPIWATELDVSAGPNQASDLDQILHELYSNPAVEGIMMWAAWSPQGCYVMCLTNNDFINLDTGNVVDKFLTELKQADDDFDAPRTTDSNGFFETSLPHGHYHVKITHPTRPLFSNFGRINVVPEEFMLPIYRFTIINPEN